MCSVCVFERSQAMLVTARACRARAIIAHILNLCVTCACVQPARALHTGRACRAVQRIWYDLLACYCCVFIRLHGRAVAWVRAPANAERGVHRPTAVELSAVV